MATAPPKSISTRRDDIAYVLPMAVFLLFTAVGGNYKDFYPLTYVLKTFIVAGIIFYFWKHYTRITWNYWWLGLLLGVLTTVQWIGQELLLLHYWPDYIRLDSKYPGNAFIPFEYFADPPAPFGMFEGIGWAWAFIIIRWMGASLLVPVMEELFWRDYLWRNLLAPADFKLAQVGEWDWKAFLIIAIVFGAGVHLQWMTAIVWGLLVGLLLVYTKSLGACIIMHAVTNFLLGAYVLYMNHIGKPQWFFW